LKGYSPTNRGNGHSAARQNRTDPSSLEDWHTTEMRVLLILLREKESNLRHLAYETKLEPLQSTPQCLYADAVRLELTYYGLTDRR
jgi:hypothetical protein